VPEWLAEYNREMFDRLAALVAPKGPSRQGIGDVDGFETKIR